MYARVGARRERSSRSITRPASAHFSPQRLRARRCRSRSTAPDRAQVRAENAGDDEPCDGGRRVRFRLTRRIVERGPCGQQECQQDRRRNENLVESQKAHEVCECRMRVHQQPAVARTNGRAGRAGPRSFTMGADHPGSRRCRLGVRAEASCARRSHGERGLHKAGRHTNCSLCRSWPTGTTTFRTKVRAGTPPLRCSMTIERTPWPTKGALPARSWSSTIWAIGSVSSRASGDCAAFAIGGPRRRCSL
jgi:hypothetical protein